MLQPPPEENGPNIFDDDEAMYHLDDDDMHDLPQQPPLQQAAGAHATGNGRGAPGAEIPPSLNVTMGMYRPHGAPGCGGGGPRHVSSDGPAGRGGARPHTPPQFANANQNAYVPQPSPVHDNGAGGHGPRRVCLRVIDLEIDY